MTSGKMLAIFSLDGSCDKEKRNALQVVADFPGIDHICTDTNGQKLIVAVVGTMDDGKLANKLRNKFDAKMEKLDSVEEYLKNAAAVSAATRANQENNRVSRIDGGKIVLKETRIEEVRVRREVHGKGNFVIKK